MNYVFIVNEEGDDSRTQTICSMESNSKFEVTVLVNYIISEAIISEFDCNRGEVIIHFYNQQEIKSLREDPLNLNSYKKDIKLPYKDGYPPYVKLALMDFLGLDSKYVEEPNLSKDNCDEFFIERFNTIIEVVSKDTAISNENDNLRGYDINLSDYITKNKIGIYTKLGSYDLYFRWM